MKNNEEKQSGKEKISNILHKASDIGKKVADNVQKGTQALAEKAKITQHDYKIKKYNPLFPKEFKSKNFHLPDIIQIRDDAERRDIDVCQGAIGWRETINKTEVLFLYDEEVKDGGIVQKSGIQFIPAPTNLAVYHVDRFDRTKYIQVDCIFNKTHEERLAELEHIAFSLGAKKYSVEILEAESVKETSTKKSSKKVNAKADLVVLEQSISVEATQTNSSTNEINQQNRIQLRKEAHAVFKGSDNPQRPTLKWFSHDETIKKLIDMRCSEKNEITSRNLKLEGTTSATMSKITASNLDGVLTVIGGNTKVKATNSSTTTMYQEASREHSSKLIYNIEF